jgi:hypothetical protein
MFLPGRHSMRTSLFQSPSDKKQIHHRDVQQAKPLLDTTNKRDV